MTTVRFFRRDGKFVGVSCEGHTEYAESGSDIVCAALSSVVQTAVLGLMQVAGINVEYSVDEKEGALKAELPEKLTERQSHDADVILKTAYLGASDLYEQFSDFINLEVQ
ncbi:MAG: ribosomal-processing cysteine protease Prp [Acutalibacteraceae bacterium]